jgi:hypothetical protein
MSAPSASSPGTDAVAPGTELIVDRLAYRHLGIYLVETVPLPGGPTVPTVWELRTIPGGGR